MIENQVIYPVSRILRNPKIFIAIAEMLEGPEWEVLADSFYDLMESDWEENPDQMPSFDTELEVCFREDPDEEAVFQVILSNGNAVELRPNEEGGGFTSVATEDDFTAVSAIYSRLIKALEEERPDLKDDIALVTLPTPGNGFLRDKDGNAFRGAFHLKSDPDKKFDFVVDVIDIPADLLKANIKPAI